jgi:hypothetical protein
MIEIINPSFNELISSMNIRAQKYYNDCLFYSKFKFITSGGEVKNINNQYIWFLIGKNAYKINLGTLNIEEIKEEIIKINGGLNYG